MTEYRLTMNAPGSNQTVATMDFRARDDSVAIAKALVLGELWDRKRLVRRFPDLADDSVQRVERGSVKWKEVPLPRS